MRDAVIVSCRSDGCAARLPRARCAPRGPMTWAAIAIKGALDRVPGLDPREVEDVIIGCAMPEAEQGMNVARICIAAGRPARSNRRP